MSLYIVSLENAQTGSQIVGAYKTEKLAKSAVKLYVESSELAFQRKQVKKDDATNKYLVYSEHGKDLENPKQLFIHSTPFELPGKKAKKDPHAPKKPLSGFMLFSTETRPTLKDLPFGEIGKKMGEMWRGLSDTDRAVYNVKSTQDKQRYLSEMSSYDATTVAPTEAVAVVSKEKTTKAKKVVAPAVVEENVENVAPAKKVAKPRATKTEKI